MEKIYYAKTIKEYENALKELDELKNLIDYEEKKIDCDFIKEYIKLLEYLESRKKIMCERCKKPCIHR